MEFVKEQSVMGAVETFGEGVVVLDSPPLIFVRSFFSLSLSQSYFLLFIYFSSCLVLYLLYARREAEERMTQIGGGEEKD